jgi:hypothetical protein
MAEGIDSREVEVNRKLFDSVVSTVGLVVALVILAAGGLVIWGSTFVNGQVHNQLASQKIFFPPKGSAAIKGPQFAAMQKYAGQQLVTGSQAETYADHFIAVHLSEVAGGKTYAQVSSEALANPSNAKLAAQADTLFKGTTLRGLLLNAYAFGKMAQIMQIIAIVFFAGGGVLLVLAGLGYWHAARSKPEQRIFARSVEEEREEAAA